MNKKIITDKMLLKQVNHCIKEKYKNNIYPCAVLTVQELNQIIEKYSIVIRGKEMAACNYENDECNDQCRYGTCRWQEKANMILKNYEDTGLSPEQVMELKERDTVKECKQSVFDHDSITCVCGSDMDKDVEYIFCPWCGQRLKEGD